MKNIKNKKLNKTITIFSIVTTLIFASYNLIVGIIYLTAWNLSISIYYYLLLLLKVFLSISSNKLTDNDKRIRNCYILSFVFLLLLNLSLIGPAIILVNNSKAVYADKIISIVIATFVFTRLIISIVNIKRVYAKDIILNKQLKMVSLASSIVSLIVLQNTLINVNGSMEGGIYILSCISTFAFLTVLLLLTIISFVRNMKISELKAAH